MPYRIAAKKSPSIKCVKCNLDISEIHNYVECDSCFKTFHLKCEGIFGVNVTRISSNESFNCKDCKTPNLNNTTPLSQKRPSSDLSPTNENKDKRCKTTNKYNEHILNEIKSLIEQSKNEMIQSQNELKLSIAEIKNNQNYLSGKFDELNQKINCLSKEHKSFKKDVTIIQKQHIEQFHIINKLEADLDSCHQKELQNNLIVGGLPNNADPKFAIEKILDNLQSTSSINEISEFYYLRKNVVQMENATQNQNINRNTAPLLLIKFKNIQSKLDLLQKKREKKTLFVNEIGINAPSDRQIYFRDHVTSFKNNLFKECREFKEKHNFKYLWMSGSQILLRKVENTKIYAVNSRNDIIKLQNQFCNTEAQSLAQSIIFDK